MLPRFIFAEDNIFRKPISKIFTALSCEFLKCAEQNGLTFVGIAMDWMITPSEIHSHMLRISQLFSMSLRIVLATGLAEVNAFIKLFYRFCHFHVQFGL